MIDLILEHLPTIITVIGGLGAWGYERNKRRHDMSRLEEENKKLRTENDTSVVALYQNALDDLKKRYDEKFTELEKEIEALRKRLAQREQEYSNLKNEFNQYKSNHK
jgi:uncharacterized protein HemX